MLLHPDPRGNWPPQSQHATAPVFRSQADAELTKAIYRHVPVLIDETKGAAGNPWGISFLSMFHMANDSGLFQTAPGQERLPLYEAKLIHQFDHRFATFEAHGAGEPQTRDVNDAEKRDPYFVVRPRYWVPAKEVEKRLRAKDWARGWLIGWRGITNATNERTVITSVLPRVGVSGKCPLLFPTIVSHSHSIACLLADLNSLVHDFVARQKVGGTDLSFFINKQLPVLPPARYTEADLAFIVPRVLELTYTAWDLRPWAEDVGYHGPPFPWDPERRARLRAELDAYYAYLYGLNRKQLRYVLDPADLTPRELEDILDPCEEVTDPFDPAGYQARCKASDYPSETFRVLKEKELKAYGEYRTRRLVLEAWARMFEGNPNPTGG